MIHFLLAAGDYGLTETANTAFDNAPPIKSVPVFVGQIISAALGLLGILFLILMLYGGYLWMMARGNEEKVDKAKDLITAAIIGLIIIVGGYAISNLVINALTKSAAP